MSTKYETLINKAIRCYKTAIAVKDDNLKKFYKNASLGYRMKAAKLTLKEAAKEATE